MDVLFSSFTILFFSSLQLTISYPEAIPREHLLLDGIPSNPISPRLWRYTLFEFILRITRGMP
jgi:hypothetical protein